MKKGTNFLVSQTSPPCKFFTGKKNKNELKKIINVDNYFAESNKWLDACKQCRDTLIYIGIFLFVLLRFVLSRSRTKGVVARLFQHTVSVSPRERHCCSFSVHPMPHPRGKGTKFLKLPQLYFNFEV